MAYLDSLMEQMDPAKPKTGFAPPLDPGTIEPPPGQPAPYAAKGPALGLEGFDAGKMGSGHTSPKYVFAKHAQGLGVNDRDELLRRLQGDESGYFKEASFGGNKGDVLNVGGQLHDDFKGIGQFDVIRAMGEGGKGWQWGEAGGGAAAAPSTGMPSMASIPGLLQGDGQSQIAQGVEQYSEPSKYLAALLAQLGGQQ